MMLIPLRLILVTASFPGVIAPLEELWITWVMMTMAVMAWVMLSGFSDAGGPVDRLLVGVIWGVGVVSGAVLSYAVLGLLDRSYVKQGDGGAVG